MKTIFKKEGRKMMAIDLIDVCENEGEEKYGGKMWENWQWNGSEFGFHNSIESCQRTIYCKLSLASNTPKCSNGCGRPFCILNWIVPTILWPNSFGQESRD